MCLPRRQGFRRGSSPGSEELNVSCHTLLAALCGGESTGPPACATLTGTSPFPLRAGVHPGVRRLSGAADLSAGERQLHGADGDDRRLQARVRPIHHRRHPLLRLRPRRPQVPRQARAPAAGRYQRCCSFCRLRRPRVLWQARPGWRMSLRPGAPNVGRPLARLPLLPCLVAVPGHEETCLRCGMGRRAHGRR